MSQLLKLFLRQLRAEDDSISAGLSHILNDETLQIIHDKVVVFLVIRQIGRCVFQYWLLSEIISDHLRHEIVYALVVCHTIADAIDECDISGTVYLHDIRDTEH